MGLFKDDAYEAVNPSGGGKNYVTSNNVAIGVVKKVYLDFSQEANGRTISPGAVELEAIGRNMSNTIIAYPYDEQFLDIPCITEVVDIHYNGTIPMYRRINFNKTINNSQPPAGQGPTNQPKAGLDNFKSLGGVVSTLAGVGGSLGDYFKKQKTHRLKVYEGDTIIQSRHGQSIRMSGYKTSGNSLGETITIRNKESAKYSTLPENATIEEDLNRDGSTILLSSGDKNNIKFIPGTPDALGGSDFKTRPDKSTKFVFAGSPDDYAFEGYPKTLNGDQCIITSDRLVFSSRKNEMIFWSKGNYGVITDGIFSVDSDNGININSKNDIDIQSFDKKINFHIGEAGEINLGSNNLRSAIDGDALIELLSDLIACVINLKNGGLLTPSGPTAGMDPVREAELKEMASKLNSLLSSRVKIQI